MTSCCFDKKISSVIRSPFFYVGDKYKLMPQLSKLFPKNINNYFEPFCGGGSSFLNTNAKNYFLNDVDKNIINLHKFLLTNSTNIKFFDEIFALIEKYLLSCSFQGKIPPKSLRDEYKKTYFAKFNKEAYNKLKNDFNTNQNDFFRLYLLLIYGFNHMLRFNKFGNFNLPVGNVDFNANVFKALNDYFDFCKDKNLNFDNQNFDDFLSKFKFSNDDFIYCDPPYLISGSEYNKIWNEFSEISLYNLLDELDKNSVKWGLSNLLTHKNKTNTILLNFAKKYEIYDIKSNYISFNDNTIKNSREVYVTNAKARI